MGVEWAIVAAVALALALVSAGWFAHGAVSAEAERRHTAELALLDATILSLRSELEADREADADGSVAAQAQVDAALALGPGVPDVVLWTTSGPAKPRSDAPAPPAPDSGPAT